MTISIPADQAARDRIRDDLDATLFVEAGAGSGKTHELIERIVRLVASGRAELRKVAAITFTEAAAAELRDRVRVRLEDAARDDALPEDERARCAARVSELDAAAIETLHGFAQRILAEHPLEAGLPPAVEVQDEIRASIAFDERWAAFVDELLADAELEGVLLQAFTLGLSLSDLRAVAWAFQENWDRLEDAEIDPPPRPHIETTLLSAQLDRVCADLGRCTDQRDELYRHLVRVDAFRARLTKAESDLDRLRVLAEPLDMKLGRGGNREDWLGVSPGDIRDGLKKAQQLRDALLDGVRGALLPHILARLRRFILDYAEERRRQGRLEFHDLLVRARGLLRSDPAVRRDVHDRFTHLLIDEFQDTDPLQIEIATLIAGDGVDGAPAPWHEASIGAGRLFFVGDPKQSIYRFRRADVDLYTQAQERFTDGTVHLTQNFRSLRPLIAWANDTFGHLMGGADGQVPYVPLEAAWPAKDVTVRVLGEAAEENVGPIREREAREIARTIQAAKIQRWQVTELDEHRERTKRDARHADIAILMPQRTSLEYVERALEDASVPYRIESRSLVYDTQEVRDLLAILRAIDDPTDEVALIAALRSPAFACGDDDLLRYYQAGGRWDYRRDKPDELPERDPVVAAVRALYDLHRRRWWEPISGVVEAVIRERRLFELAFSRRRPRERWQRYRFVLDQARAFAEAGGRTLRQFVDWAERQAQEKTRVIETVVPDPDDDAVRIMTIHAAKGLEFPIVILTGLNVRKGRSRYQEVIWRDDNRPEVRIGGSGARFQTRGYEELATREQTMEQQEKVRLLYVGATRARDHLILSLHHKVKESSHASSLLDRCAASPDLWRPVDLSEQAPLPLEDSHAVTFDDSPERRDGWLETRAERIAALARVHAVSATEIATRAGADDPNLAKDAPVEEQPPWRRGRAGTALGRAVHAVLQSIDLATGADVEGAASAQAAAEGIADRADEVARLVSSALQSSAVREALAAGRYWRELFVSAAVDGARVEGFVDLLYETRAGLVVVDYKTDIVSSGERLEEALARYRPQGAAYALALQEALGRPVDRCVFLFVQPRAAQEREIEDLPAAIDEVRATLRDWDWRAGAGS